ncbi:intradiol ring-cleavage dioxygenase [Sphingobium phenoxybenzoativorans]|uniref:Intradiol ring-cleavage dioxygenase n=1 Tax=Sphingobium phenoxybenzoativorans TaxID=1592790 RepID=A0A975K4D9_9SPHN|nr:intradiol ring-cleavage dioxygenase [Sphingobium phenoxybenzoativorans]QUT04604.1 intradiol ring-cleavage dioxygenase [Sphingobium phenoxybenzoativorans]
MTDISWFEEDRSAEIVSSRTGPAANPRLREVVDTLVRHMHAAVREAKVTPEEWMTGIQFLTDTGHMCNEWRQEFILLSDVLGVSMLVDAVNHHRPNGSTENTVLGPFHVANAPEYPLGANICLDGKGEPLLVRGRVIDTEGQPIAGVTLDVWQANEDGFYDVQQKGIQPDFNLRGIFRTDADGYYWFRSVKPRWYPIPDDGPVGKMLTALDRHPNRAAHLHFIVEAAGYDRLVTHIFTPDCPYLPGDAVFGVKQSLIADFELIDEPGEAAKLGFSSPYWSVQWDFTLAREGQLRPTDI